MARAYFCAYYSYLDLFRELTDEEVGRLMRAVFIYAADGMEIDLPPVERMAFLAISGQIDRDARRYEKICERNRENALMRSQAVAANEKEKHPALSRRVLGLVCCRGEPHSSPKGRGRMVPCQ